MALQSSGEIKISQINAELGRATNSTSSLDTLESGGYVAINTASPSYPSDTRPAAMSEWYSYDHSATTSSQFSIINNGQSSSASACALSGPDDITLYHGTGGGLSCPSAGTYVYTDAAKTILFNGQLLWWYSNSCSTSYLISTGGYVESVSVCTPNGNISSATGGAPAEVCGFEVSIGVYKSGTTQAPNAGETLWDDINLSAPYNPTGGYDQWYVYQPSGTADKYSVFLTLVSGETVIDLAQICK